MPKRNAVAFQTTHDADDARKPGAFWFLRQFDTADVVGVVHACPCGCGKHSALHFVGKAPLGKQTWTVTGDWPKATLDPSIGIKPQDASGAYHWHGYLKSGVFEEC